MKHITILFLLLLASPVLAFPEEWAAKGATVKYVQTERNGGAYFPLTKLIVVNNNSNMEYTRSHEIGHHFYYHFLDESERVFDTEEFADAFACNYHNLTFCWKLPVLETKFLIIKYGGEE